MLSPRASKFHSNFIRIVQAYIQSSYFKILLWSYKVCLYPATDFQDFHFRYLVCFFHAVLKPPDSFDIAINWHTRNFNIESLVPEPGVA